MVLFSLSFFFCCCSFETRLESSLKIRARRRVLAPQFGATETVTAPELRNVAPNDEPKIRLSLRLSLHLSLSLSLSLSLTLVHREDENSLRNHEIPWRSAKVGANHFAAHTMRNSNETKQINSNNNNSNNGEGGDAKDHKAKSHRAVQRSLLSQCLPNPKTKHVQMAR